MTTLGILHPGDMGSAVGAAARLAGARVIWASAGRREATRARAAGDGLEDVGSLDAVAGASAIIVSICPPHAAVDVARAVAARGFAGCFVDANAVAPATAREIAAVVEKASATFVDGGIIGPPPRRPGTTRLYLSGSAAPRVAALFAAGSLETIVLDGGPGAASALKMAYAAWSKGTAALLLAIRALARAEGVDAALVAEWQRSGSMHAELPARAEQVARANARKAWRYVGEMEEIAATFAGAGLPDGFHGAAADIYRRLEAYKDAAAPPPLDELLRALRARE